MTKKEKRIAELAEAFETAKKSAEAYQNSDDGGSCNLDSPTIYYKRSGDPERLGKSAELTADDVQKAAEMAGVSVWQWKLWKSSCFVVNWSGMRGQANRRSRMAEAFSKSLEKSGFGAGMFCQAD